MAAMTLAGALNRHLAMADGQPWSPWYDAPWRLWFAWRPVRVEGRLVWGRVVARRARWRKWYRATLLGSYLPRLVEHAAVECFAVRRG